MFKTICKTTAIVKYSYSSKNMPTFLEGFQIDSNVHSLFLPPIWRATLSCFKEFDAVHLDCVYGYPEIRWLIQERITTIPSSTTWMLAAKNKSVGMMLYLIEWNVLCPDFDAILQFATDFNVMEVLVLFTHPMFEGDWGLSKIVGCPVLDTAVKSNHLEVVRYIMWKFPTFTETMLKKHVHVINRLVKLNNLVMFELVVPKLAQVSSAEGLELAARKNYYKLLRYAVKHLDPNYIQKIPDSVLVFAAKYGNLKILKFLFRRTKFIPPEAFQQAFSWGFVNICTYIQKRFPGYKPTQNDILDACEHGHHKVMSLVPKNTVIPKGGFEKAAASRNCELIYVLKDMCPEYKFTTSLLTKAAKSGCSEVCLAVYDCGDYKLKTLPVGFDVIMASKSMYVALDAFSQGGFKVYNQNTLIEASKTCDLRLISAIVESKSFNITPSIIRDCLNNIYVSINPKCNRANAYKYLMDLMPQKKRQTVDDLHRYSTSADKALSAKRTKC